MDRSRRSWAPLVILAFSIPCVASCAHLLRARDPAARMAALDREALDAYQAGELTQARDLLNNAVAIGKDAALDRDPVMARAYLDLGAVFLATNDRRQGMQYLGYALRINPDIEPDPGIATPPLKKTLALARSQVKHRRGPASVAALSLKLPVVPAKREASVAARTAVIAPTRPAPAPPAAAPPPPPKVDPPKAPAPEPEDNEPDLPATITQPLYCLTPDEAPPSVQIPLRCVPRPGLSVARMVLFYRGPGSERFTAVPMARSRKGWYAGVVPPAASAGKSLQYYVEAHGPGNKVSTTNGQADSPNLLLIREGAKPAGLLAAAEPRGEAPVRQEKDEENPLAVVEQQRARALEEGARRRSSHAVWLAVGIGSGYGWHPTRRLEFHDENQIGTGVSPAGLIQVTPEVGLQLGARYAVSIQGRLQIIPDSGSGDNKPGSPARTAVAAFVRVHRFYGLGSAQLFLTGTLGAGDGFRLTVPPHPELGAGRSDTVRGGPLALGPGAGFIYHFTRHFGWAVETRLLVGFPAFAALGEASTGAQLSF
jgi:Tfp pilus assembly protein PilF